MPALRGDNRAGRCPGENRSGDTRRFRRATAAPTFSAMRSSDGLDEAFGSGLVGAVTVAALHEVSRHLLRDAPRLDIMGEKLVESAFRRFGRRPPESTRALSWALGNVGTDTVLFALVGAGDVKRPVVRGALLGALAGVSAVVLPSLLGVGSRETAKNLQRMAMTVGMYVTAGVAAGLAHRLRSA